MIKSSHCQSCLSLFILLKVFNLIICIVDAAMFTLIFHVYFIGFEFYWKMAAPRTGVKSMKDYLKKYESSEVIEKKKKKMKMKKPSKPEPTGVLVVDEDPVWQKQVDPQEEDNENDSAGNALETLS